MTTPKSKTLEGQLESNDTAAKTPNWGRWLSGLALLAFVGLFIAVMRTDLDPRVANPNVQGRPRPVKFLFGIDNWMTQIQIGTIVGLIALVVIFVRGWRRNPGSSVMLMFLCTTLIVWQDPIMNWAPYAVYNPDRKSTRLNSSHSH